MNEPECIEKVVSALAKVPAKQLLIIELVNRLTENGELNSEEVAESQPEIQLAIAEAKMYGAHTMVAVDSLKRLKAVSG